MESKNLIKSTNNGLYLYNSLTRKKELFVTKIPNHIKWYCCGPTVYDSSHMGHARAYISFDIIRRVLQNYFNYNITYVMNITDIEDKIIKRARRNYLWEKFENEHKIRTFDDLYVYVKPALEINAKIVENTTDADLKAYRMNFLNQMNTRINQLKFLNDEIDVTEFKEIICDFLDEKYGMNICDHSIFFRLTQFYETDFLNDMKQLNVLPPTLMPRISEFVDEVISFIKVIIEKGYAYVSNESVYFDTVEFSKTHRYAKLVPEAVGDTNKLVAGEGELSANFVGEKRSPRDFVLWKCSKKGEPFWPSPWGNGRPGWHIECSAMAAHFFGDLMDIHSGGCDLKFPHHDNEIAQSEARFNSDHWVNYFLHAGHLTIEGQKMSKSLKNFITIKEALKEHSARQIRLAFLQHLWGGPLDYSKTSMSHAVQLEKSITNFFTTLRSILKHRNFNIQKNDSSSPSKHNFNKKELTLYQL